MSRPNDIGGLPGFGAIPVEPEAEARVFHGDWEKRVFGLCLATRGDWTIDMFRGARERDSSADYLRRGYYENWLVGLERLAAESELVSGAPGAKPSRGWDSFMPAPSGAGPARFRIGDRARAVSREARGHTRLPGYVHGRTGRVVADHGVHRFPDRSAEGVVEGQRLYTVSFDAREVWGEAADGRGSVLLDLFDGYLEPVA